MSAGREEAIWLRPFFMGIVSTRWNGIMIFSDCQSAITLVWKDGMNRRHKYVDVSDQVRDVVSHIEGRVDYKSTSETAIEALTKS